jgi:acyl-CoA thioester hydrolase
LARSDFRFTIRLRVRFSEVDMQGVVYNPRYLEYLELVNSDYARNVLRPAGEDHRIPLRVAKTTIEYKAPTLFEEELDLFLRCARIGNSSVSYAFEFHGKDRNDLRACGETLQVHIDDAGKPARVPDSTVAILEAYEGRKLRE